ncbi:YhcH/YjgK/YiaL family protein [Gabonibacter chumensis]|uniref:YhcH/YjgK/YiaL family protein n=1 Tax=Gabonibacter chumensis TaxID=2972474 RepID=UPI002573BA66|nr:YhcH/YjgK/YiaL family protein [Gabonibacter chumensis]MCR9013339.1 YhcH/YjgK/YiaL family protein [Gabonibacter chumensis]
MIIDKLLNSSCVEDLNPYFKAVFDYIKTHDMTDMPLGRIDIAGEDAYIKVDEVDGKEKEEAFLERHESYIDIQLPLLGEEIYGWKAKEDLREIKKAYDVEGDFMFYQDRPSFYFPLQAGEFVIFFPEDAHAPCIGSGKIKKIVAKIKTMV